MTDQNRHNHLREVDRNPRRGATSIFFALSLMGLMGMVALVVDVGQLYSAKAHLQGVADAAALAAVKELPSAIGVLETAQEYAELNYPGGGTIADDDVTLGCWDDDAFVASGDGSCSLSDLNAVRVIARLATSNGNALPLFMSGFLGGSSVDIGATAIATESGSETGCVWVLHENRNDAFNVESKAEVDAADCDIYVNSSSASAMKVKDSGTTLVAQNITINGGYSLSGGASLSPSPPDANTGDAYADPLSGTLSAPDNVSDPCGSGHHGSATKINHDDEDNPLTLYPGVYCGGIGAKSGAIVNLEPGVYVIRGGELGGGAGLKTENNDTELNGTGVMFYLTCETGPCPPGTSEKHKIEFEDEPIVSLTAPTSGDYKGILFYQDPNMAGQAGGDANVFDTNESSLFDGVFYFPSHWLDFKSGSGAGATARIVIIAETLKVRDDHTKLNITTITNPPDALGSGNVRLGW